MVASSLSYKCCDIKTRRGVMINFSISLLAAAAAALRLKLNKLKVISRDPFSRLLTLGSKSFRKFLLISVHFSDAAFIYL